MKPLIRETQDKKYIEVIGHYDDPILCAKLTMLADLCAVKHENGYALFDKKDSNKLNNINKKLDFTHSPDEGGGSSISTLVGTKWAIRNDAVNGLGNTNSTYAINFTSNSNNYTSMKLYGTSGVPVDGNYNISYNSEQVYGASSGWGVQADRIIEISDGTDATNANLIAWLQANATQVPVVDLSGTSWVFNNELNLLSSGDYYLTFNSNNEHYTQITAGVSSSRGFYLRYRDPDFPLNVYAYTSYEQEPIWANENYKTISITGGTDATNPDLIVWLSQNATYQVPASSYTITIDGTGYSVPAGDTLLINQSGLYDSMISTQIFTFTPTTGRFFGFNTSSGQSSPSNGYALNDTFTASENLTLYSVEQQPTKTFDLSTLTLSSGSHTITLKAKGEGKGASAVSNEITYTAGASATLKIYSNDENTEKFTIYSDGTAVANVSLAPDNAILDSSGGYIVASDGYLTTTEVFTPAGYSGNIDTYDYMSIGNEIETKIKFDTPPSNENDYDAYVDLYGNLTGITSYSNKTCVYF